MRLAHGSADPAPWRERALAAAEFLGEPGDPPAAAMAAMLADELIRCGLREVVLAPGSRSAPLAIEFHRRAEAGDLRLSVRIDERSAAFCALGLAKRAEPRSPSSAPRGRRRRIFTPRSSRPMSRRFRCCVLTADRPPELRGTGANQTIDQLRLYGPAVRWFCEVGVPEDRPFRPAQPGRVLAQHRLPRMGARVGSGRRRGRARAPESRAPRTARSDCVTGRGRHC